MEAAYGAERYREACGLLPEELRRQALALPEAWQGSIEELRLRVGRPLAVTLPEGETPLTGSPVTGEDLERVVDRATAHSPYVAEETIRQGFVTAARRCRKTGATEGSGTSHPWQYGFPALVRERRSLCWGNCCREIGFSAP